VIIHEKEAHIVGPELNEHKSLEILFTIICWYLVGNGQTSVLIIPKPKIYIVFMFKNGCVCMHSIRSFYGTYKY
jgi:hypothetical protein